MNWHQRYFSFTIFQQGVYIELPDFSAQTFTFEVLLVSLLN